MTDEKLNEQLKVCFKKYLKDYVLNCIDEYSEQCEWSEDFLTYFVETLIPKPIRLDPKTGVETKEWVSTYAARETLWDTLYNNNTGGLNPCDYFDYEIKVTVTPRETLSIT